MPNTISTISLARLTLSIPAALHIHPLSQRCHEAVRCDNRHHRALHSRAALVPRLVTQRETKRKRIIWAG